MNDITVRDARQLGAALRRHRSERKLKQNDVAALTGLRQSTVSEVEAGSPFAQLRTIERLLAALDLELVVRPRTSTEPSELARFYR